MVVHSYKNRAFVFGFLSGLFLFVALNIYVVFRWCNHCVWRLGFPLPIYHSYSGNPSFSLDRGVTSASFTEFLPENIFIDVIVVFLASLGVGVIFELVQRTVLSRGKRID